tara:strand:- start:1605 stop:1784 length:180 start_codon:yes stop_codon:yes gene_type:complete
MRKLIEKIANVFKRTPKRQQPLPFDEVMKRKKPSKTIKNSKIKPINKVRPQQAEITNIK